MDVKLCEACETAKKRQEIVKTMDAVEKELFELESVCEIMANMTMETPPPPYLYRRIEEHVKILNEKFNKAWEAVFA